MSMNTTILSPDQVYSALMPVLMQCFGVILLGFFAGKFDALSKSQVRGLGTYVTKFALPAIFFNVMLTIDFTGIDWYLLLAVWISKSILFFSTFVLTLIISRGKEIGLAGILALFTSQSNDVALAYPILNLLYPELASYVYLFGPFQLVILNPCAYFALEWHAEHIKKSTLETRNDPQSNRHFLTCKKIFKVIFHVITNPLFFMTVIGVIFNFILDHKLPCILKGFFQSLGDSFGATALFYLGFSMIDKFRTINLSGIYILVLILLGKIVILPFICRELTVLLLQRYESVNMSVVKSSFTFLYSGAPTAPPVFLFASQYNIIPEVIGTGLVIGTFSFAPMLFIYAGMATLVSVDLSVYDKLLQSTAFYASSASFLCCIWTLAILLVNRKVRRFLFQLVICLIVAVMIFSLTMILSAICEQWDSPSSNQLCGYIKFAILCYGCFAARIWTSLIAIALLLQKRHILHTSFALNRIPYLLVGFFLPLFITGVYVLVGSNDLHKNKNFTSIHNLPQLICTFLVLFGCITICLVCLLLLSRQGTTQPHLDNSPLIQPSPTREFPRNILANQQQGLDRHFMLLIFLSLSMFFGLCVICWQMVREEISGVFVVVEFLDQVFNFGQGVIIFVVFGIDTDLIVLPILGFISRVRTRLLFWLCSQSCFPNTLSLSTDEIGTFADNHLSFCLAAISGSLTLHSRSINEAFTVVDFHKWVNEKKLTTSLTKTIYLLHALINTGFVKPLDRIPVGTCFYRYSELTNESNVVVTQSHTIYLQYTK